MSEQDQGASASRPGCEPTASDAQEGVFAESHPSRGAVPVCRECGQPSPLGDPCETCAEVERILSLSDDEMIADSSDEELGWARGFKEGLRVGRMAEAQVRRSGRRERDLQSIGDVLAYWLRFRGQEQASPDAHVILAGENAPPHWPTVGQLAKWLEVLRDSDGPRQAETPLPAAPGEAGPARAGTASPEHNRDHLTPSRGG